MFKGRFVISFLRIKQIIPNKRLNAPIVIYKIVKIAIIDNNTIIHYEETETFKNKGVHVSGLHEAVQDFTRNIRVLEQRKLGKQLNVMLDVPFTDDLKLQAEQAGVMIEKARFQDYLVNLTKKGDENA